MAIDLSKLKPRPTLTPPRIVMYGPHGLGKTTFASSAPAPFFIQTEDGAGAIPIVSLGQVKAWAGVMEQLAALFEQDHPYRTLVLDSLDWMEPIVWAETCRRGGKADIEEFGYGKGYVYAAEVWREFFDGLTALRDEKGMMVILIAHCEVKRFDNPETDPYDRYQIKLHARAASIVQEWADCVLFTNYKTIVSEKDVGFKKKVARGISTGTRVIYTEERPAALAKNRYNLPPELPLSWEAFSDALSKSFNLTA